MKTRNRLYNLKIGDTTMKKMMMMAVMMVMTISANAMSYNVAREEALFLSDKMAYELNLTDAQYDAVYEINLDYLMSVNVHADVFGIWWDRRNADLRLVLSAWQYDRFMELTYFFRPISWLNGVITFHIYHHYDRGRFFRGRPTVFVSYRGGHNRKPSHFYADRRVAKPHHGHLPGNNHHPGNNNHTAMGNHSGGHSGNSHTGMGNHSGGHSGNSHTGMNNHNGGHSGNSHTAMNSRSGGGHSRFGGHK